jgi:hypothetical protein
MPSYQQGGGPSYKVNEVQQRVDAVKGIMCVCQSTSARTPAFRGIDCILPLSVKKIPPSLSGAQARERGGDARKYRQDGSAREQVGTAGRPGQDLPQNCAGHKATHVPSEREGEPDDRVHLHRAALCDPHSHPYLDQLGRRWQ